MHCSSAECVRTRAPTLPIGKNYRGSQRQGVPFSVSLSRFDGVSGLAKPFQIIFSPVGSGLRDQRILRACDDKCPKLARWKESKGARTILVLEHNDVQTTNVSFVTDSYLRVTPHPPATP